MSRINFPSSVKVALAKRAGYRCSHPDCPAITMGPSEESATATSNTGEAAHINSASSGKGARRHNSLLEPEYISSIENGVWCCNLHAELIDNDEVTYSVDLLKSWRCLAETKAKIKQAYGDINLTAHPGLLDIGLTPESVSISQVGDENKTIGQAIKFSCIEDIWGRQLARALRDFLIEHSRNSLTHGQASKVSIKFLP